MRQASLPAGLLTIWLVVVPCAAQPFPITPLVLEGDVVPGVGAVTSISNLAVNAAGDWLVEADTDFADIDADGVLLRNGALLLREGDGLALPAGASLGGFDAININANGDSGWNFFLDGPASNLDSGIYYNTTLVIQESDTSSAVDFSPGTRYIGFFEARLNAADEMVLVASMDDPAIPSSVDRAIVTLELDAGGALLGETVVAKEGDVLPGQVDAVADFATGPHESAFNDAGQVLYFADLAGATATDGTIWIDQSLVAQEGGGSPVAGRNYETLSSRGRDLNGLGDVAFKANLDGSTIDDEMIVRAGQAFVRERDTLPPLGLFTLTGFGTGSGPVQIDDGRNVLWFGEWNDPDTDVNSALFLNTLILVQEGVTLVGGQLVDTIAAGQDAFALSENGRFVIFEATLQDGTNGAFLIEVTAPPPVPDGAGAPGTMMTATRNANGTDIDVDWDAAACPADDYQLLYGDLADVASYAYAGAECGLGTGGSATFTPAPGDLFWVIVGLDASKVEGLHGFDGAGAPRLADSGGLCGVEAQINGTACP